jgi:hypothetical protein
MSVLMVILAVAATLAIFATTRRGREVLKQIGLRDRVSGAASSEDFAYLLRACGGDRHEMDRRVAVERDRFPALTEAEHFRRAIRKVMAQRKD